jgi:hypothetical protein
LGRHAEIDHGQESDRMIHVRNLREGEAATLPAALLDTGTPYVVPEWAWAVEIDSSAPFALIIASFSHGWLLLCRVLAVSPLPPEIPLTWVMEALPQVFAEARLRGCVGWLTFLADDRPQEAKLARIVALLPGASLLPFYGSMGVGLLAQVEEREEVAQ